jgi:hypothetical protein
VASFQVHRYVAILIASVKLLLVFQKSMGPPMNGQPLGLVIHGAVSEP